MNTPPTTSRRRAALAVAFLAIVLTLTGDVDTAPITGLAVVFAILSLARP